MSDLLKKVFAYGTLRPSYHSHGYVVSEILSLVDYAKLADLDGAVIYVSPKVHYPMAVPMEGGLIRGELLDFSGVDDNMWNHSVLKKLDSIENVGKSGGELFTRQVVTVKTLDDGQLVDAWMYLYNKVLKDHHVVLSGGDWLEIANPSSPSTPGWASSSSTITIDEVPDTYWTDIE